VSAALGGLLLLPPRRSLRAVVEQSPLSAQDSCRSRAPLPFRSLQLTSRLAGFVSVSFS
jgi:hypothetical protein